jgi:hypothetical protein
MTYDSIKKSYKTFIRLLFVSDDEKCKENIYGLYVFAYSLTDYIIKNGYVQLFNEADIQTVLSKIDVDELKDNEARRNGLISIMVDYPAVMDCMRTNHASVFEYVSNCVVLNPKGLSKYKVFYPRSDKTLYTFFLENKALQDPGYTETLYKTLCGCDDFDIAVFMQKLVSRIPAYFGFDDADSFMRSFISHLEEMSIETIEEIISVYKKNSQCTNRGRHSADMAIVNKYLEEHRTTEDQ